jgi:acetyltransferase-like isoleucine patch superfamily enzyme
MELLKAALRGVALCLVFPVALASGFGRWRGAFQTGGHLLALVPGLPGDYLRTAYYRLTLEQCAVHWRISFGSFFAHPDARVEEGVYIGSYSVLGRTRIGARTQIASGVQILSGRRQHGRSGEGKIDGAKLAHFDTVSIGADCWIGAGAIVMADVGARTTVGAAAVVVKPLPEGVVAVGNPARVRATGDSTPLE